MKLVAPLALLFSLGAWFFAALMTANLLSGPFEDRTCLTDCVQTHFFSSVGLAAAGIVAGLVAFFASNSRVLGGSALAIVLPLCAIFLAVYLIGNYGALLF